MKWTETTRALPCPVCGKDGWCAISDDGLVKCMRLREGSFAQREDASGMAFFHKPAGLPPQPYLFEKEEKRPKKRLKARTLAKLYGESLMNSYALVGLSEDLRAPLATLGRLCVGWLDRATLIQAGTKCPAQGGHSFPMRNAEGQIIGFRLRVGHLKYSLAGGSNGLFIPTGTEGARTLLVVEGPTDCAAALAYGHQCIGRPNNGACTDMLSSYITRVNPERVAIIIDNDREGSTAREQTLAGAKRLVDALPMQARVWEPIRHKDLRAMYHAGETLKEGLKRVEGL